ncbi:MAG: hypothetical protein GWP08_02920 [Nitrospiraceae bacterium]|nr:hypothetical protein [Nitrospiraceae bacterium]
MSASPACAETGIIERVGSVFDDLAHGFDIVGEKAQRLFGPGLGFGEDETGGFSEERTFSESYPVARESSVSITNEFGEIRVGAWDNQVVQVSVQIMVRAESEDLAQEIARTIDIRTTKASNHFDARTILPDTRSGMGKPTIEVNYTVTVPRDANVTARNDFGDTYVTGVEGTLALDVRYGAIGLLDIAGAVNVRSRGEFGLRAEGLRQGGAFELDGAQAYFVRVDGALRVSNFRGSVDLRNLGPEVAVDVVSESGPIYYHVGEEEAPDLTATTLFGTFESDIPLSREVQGGVAIARSPNAESRQRIDLRATFANVVIQQEGAEPPRMPEETAGSQLFKEGEEWGEDISENALVTIDAVVGNVRVTGTDKRRLSIQATKFVRLQSPSDVGAAMEALQFRIERHDDGGITAKTAVVGDMAALGCTSYRVDLVVECPRTVSLAITAQDGHTFVSDLGGAVTVRQTTGAVTMEYVKGALDLVNKKGDVQAVACEGPVQAKASYGDITLSDIYGDMSATCVGGKIVIESPHAGITARNTGGDVRIISFDAVAGDYDVMVEQGNISILLPPSTDASLSVKAENGYVESAVPLTGTIDRELQEFIKVNSGPHRVTLHTRSGKIRID